MQQPNSSPLTPSKQHSSGGPAPWDVEADIAALFSKHSVKDVRKIEQKTRLDIERKKEELRQMVGERYRDLIDAADSIMGLRTGSEQVGESMGRLMQVCHSLQQAHFVKGLGGMRGPPARNETHLITAQLKLLADAPEKIWHRLEKQQYLDATQLFLEARHTHSQLLVSLPRCALLQQLWHATASFRSTILDCCKRHLQGSDRGVPAMLASLCTIVMLEGCSLRQVFTQFLLAQKVAIQAVFHPMKQMHCSVKTQLCEAVSVIRRSILMIANIFSINHGQGSSMLFTTVKDFTSKQRKGCLSSQRAALAEIPSKDIHVACLEWLTACGEDVSQGVWPLLGHVTTVKGLSGIRTALHSLLAEPEKQSEAASCPDPPLTSCPDPPLTSTSSWPEQWSELSGLVTGANICIWQRFLQQLFLDRVEAILAKYFSTVEEHAINALHQLLDGMTSDPSCYFHDINVTSQLWVEDEAPGRGRDVGRGGRVNTLALKTKACTPNVYSLCQSMDEKLKVIVEDAAHYMQPSANLPGGQKQPIVSTNMGEEFPFHLHGDHDRIQEFLRHSTIQCFTRFLEKVTQMVAVLQSQLKVTQTDFSSSSVTDRLLLIARVCQSLTEFCPSLSLLSSGCVASSNAQAFRAGRFQGQRRTAKRKEEDGESSTVHLLLNTQCFSIHKLWAECSAHQFVSKYKEQLLSSSELNTLSSSLVWDEISILEEAESGKQVTSIIRVPTQASVYVTSFLFAACQEISRIGGHTIERSLLQHFSGNCILGVLRVHQSILSSSNSTAIHQNCALQLLFNVRFLSSVLSSPKDLEEDIANLQQVVLNQLHTYIDPFDLDVFTPHILSALERQLQRSSVLLGLLLALRGSAHHVLSSQKPAPSSTQEKHVIIPLFPSIPRFPSLPISTSTAGQNKPLLTQKQQCSDEDVQAPRTFLETVAFFHHM